MSQHGGLLVTVLGLDPKPACYTLGGESVETALAPLALVKLLAPQERPERILAKLKERARLVDGRVASASRNRWVHYVVM